MIEPVGILEPCVSAKDMCRSIQRVKSRQGTRGKVKKREQALKTEATRMSLLQWGRIVFEFG